MLNHSCSRTCTHTDSCVGWCCACAAAMVRCTAYRGCFPFWFFHAFALSAPSRARFLFVPHARLSSVSWAALQFPFFFLFCRCVSARLRACLPPQPFVVSEKEEDKGSDEEDDAGEEADEGDEEADEGEADEDEAPEGEPSGEGSRPGRAAPKEEEGGKEEIEDV